LRFNPGDQKSRTGRQTEERGWDVTFPVLLGRQQHR
jgi:hypothetical protein